MAQPALDIVGVSKMLKNLGYGGDQQNPYEMAQMSQQAAPEDESVPPMLRAARAYQSFKKPQSAAPAPMMPPQPIPVEAPPGATSQPTQSPAGSTPQEMIPSQPAMANWNTPINPLFEKAYENFRLPNNTQTMREMATAEDNYAKAQIAQRDELQNLKENLANFMGAPQGTNWAPLASLIDARYGGNLTKVAESMAPQTPQQRAQTTAILQEKIADLQGKIPQEQLDLMKTKLAQMGYMDERALKAEVAKLNAAAKVQASTANQPLQLARLGLQEQRLGLQTDKEARGTVNNDSMLKTMVPRLEGAAKIGELIDAANTGKVVSNQALLGQVNAEIARLETGSQSPGLGQSEKTELLDEMAKWGALRDSITGKPTDAVRPEVLGAGKKLVNELSGSYMKGIDARFATLKAGMQPQQQKIADEKHQALKATYTPRFGGWNGLEQTKFWNGKTYKQEGDHWVEQ